MPPAPSLVLLLAEIPVPGSAGGGVTADQAHLITWGIAAVIFSTLLNIVALVFAGIKALRRTPPLHEIYATKAELRDVVARAGKMDEGLAEIYRELRVIGKALGRVEGMEKSIEVVNEAHSRHFEEIAARLGSIETRISR